MLLDQYTTYYSAENQKELELTRRETALREQSEEIDLTKRKLYMQQDMVKVCMTSKDNHILQLEQKLAQANDQCSVLEAELRKTRALFDLSKEQKDRRKRDENFVKGPKNMLRDSDDSDAKLEKSIENFQEKFSVAQNFGMALDEYTDETEKRQQNLKNLSTIVNRLSNKGCTSVSVQTDGLWAEPCEENSLAHPEQQFTAAAHAER